MSEAAVSLEKAGADFFLLCTNTMHKLAPTIEKNVSIPLLHIADAAAEILLAGSIKTAGLLGTAFTMEEDFYRKRLLSKFGLEVLIPNKADRQLVNRVVFDELCCGLIRDKSKDEYLRVINDLAQQGAEAIILGCTEIGLLVKQDDVQVQLVDTTPVHAAKAVRLALDD